MSKSEPFEISALHPSVRDQATLQQNLWH